MAKGTSLVSTLHGKVGSLVTYKLADSNNKETQGVRSYQPVVKNPRTYAQAEQRAKLAPINSMYRALKPVITRMYETSAYGNESRRRFLRAALEASSNRNTFPWLNKGDNKAWPIGMPMSVGSLSLNVSLAQYDGTACITFANGVTLQLGNTLGSISTALIGANVGFVQGDQITFVSALQSGDNIIYDVTSIVLDTTSTNTFSGLAMANNILRYTPSLSAGATAIGSCVIVSRAGSDGKHLRTNSPFGIAERSMGTTPYSDDAKFMAIISYQSADANSDWPQESVNGSPVNDSQPAPGNDDDDNG